MDITWDSLLYLIHKFSPCTPVQMIGGLNIDTYKISAESDGGAALSYYYTDGYGDTVSQIITDKSLIKKLVSLAEMKIIVSRMLHTRIADIESESNEMRAILQEVELSR